MSLSPCFILTGCIPALCRAARLHQVSLITIASASEVTISIRQICMISDGSPLITQVVAASSDRAVARFELCLGQSQHTTDRYNRLVCRHHAQKPPEEHSLARTAQILTTLRVVRAIALGGVGRASTARCHCQPDPHMFCGSQSHSEKVGSLRRSHWKLSWMPLLFQQGLSRLRWPTRPPPQTSAHSLSLPSVEPQLPGHDHYRVAQLGAMHRGHCQSHMSL